jgi:putative ABC transport system permease protein
MAGPRWRKILADLRLSRSRTVLVILSIAIGVFAVGSMLTTREVLQRGLDESFEAASASSAVIFTEPFEADVVEATRAMPEVADAEGRTTVAVRLQAKDGTWRNLDLTAIGNFDDTRVDRVMHEEGDWPPAVGEALIERTSLTDANLTIGEEVTIETPEGDRHTIRVSGTAYDPGKIAPAMADGQLNGYITLDTLATLGQPEAFTELHVVAAAEPRDLRQGEQVAGLARDDVLEPNGIAVHRIAVQDTPRYHSEDLGKALILILTLLGGFILLLGVFLVINTVSAIMSQQVRQVGIMKAIGGQQRQIATLYLGLALGYGVLAVIVAVPLAALGAWAVTGFLTELLNYDANGPWFPPRVVGIELTLGLLVPVLAALVPVLRGTRITVREAITSYGLGDRAPAGGLVDRIAGRLPRVPRPILLSIGNTFRRRGRLALTLITLTLGGALFASVASMQTSLDATLEHVLQYSDYDVRLTLDDSVPAANAIEAAEAVDGVDRAEGWIATNPSFVRADGTQSSNIWLTAVPADTELVRPTLVEGRWLQPGEGEALVVNVDFQGAEPDIQLGDTVTLKVEGAEVRWPVVGIVSGQLMGPVIYAPYEPLSEAIGMSGEANQVVLVTGDDSADARTEVATQVEQELRSAGLPVGQIETREEMRTGTQGLFDIVVMMLLAVAVLLVLVGAIGLTGAMSLSVLERRREIGVMRSLGASNRMVARIVIVEGLVIGLLSWLLGGLLALPLSWALSNVIGVALLQSPLAFTFSAVGLLLWLVIVVVIAVLASLVPARGAWRISVREVLAYE